MARDAGKVEGIMRRTFRRGSETINASALGTDGRMFVVRAWLVPSEFGRSLWGVRNGMIAGAGHAP